MPLHCLESTNSPLRAGAERSREKQREQREAERNDLFLQLYTTRATMSAQPAASNMFETERFEFWESLLRNIQSKGKHAKEREKDKTPVLISAMCCSNNVLVISTKLGSLIRCNANGKQYDEIELNSEKDPVKRIFIDPTGNHVLICQTSGVVYYLHSRANKPKKVSTLSSLSIGSGQKAVKHSIECVCFDQQQSSEAASKSFLVGTNLGAIFEVGSLEPSTSSSRVSVGGSSSLSPPCHLVMQVPDVSTAITQIYSGNFKTALSKVNRKQSGSTVYRAVSYVLFATVYPTRIYYFATDGDATNNSAASSAGRGSSNIVRSTFHSLFTEVQQRNGGRHIEIPSLTLSPSVQLQCRTSSSSPPTFALLTDTGIYHGELDSAYSSDTQLQTQLLPFLPQEEAGAGSGIAARAPPCALCMTDFHFLVLYPTQIQVQ